MLLVGRVLTSVNTLTPCPGACLPCNGHSKGVAGPSVRPQSLAIFVRRLGRNRRLPRSSASGPAVSSVNSMMVDMGSPADYDDTAIVLVDHGSKRAEANAMLEEFADMYRSHTRRQKVEIAHMELAEPSIGAAVAKCASEGYRKVVVAPYFLSRGRHITSDIPAMVAEAQRAHPEVSCVIADPIGLDPLMAELIEKRVAGALQTS